MECAVSYAARLLYYFLRFRPLSLKQRTLFGRGPCLSRDFYEMERGKIVRSFPFQKTRLLTLQFVMVTCSNRNLETCSKSFLMGSRPNEKKKNLKKKQFFEFLKCIVG